MNTSKFVAPGVAVSVPAVETITVMSLSPAPADHHFLETALYDAASPTRTWIVRKQADFALALPDLRAKQIPIVLCDDALPWRDLLRWPDPEINGPPLVIVTSRLADESMWAELLNLGGYDLLAKPFDQIEVIRVMEAAWLHWRHQIQPPAKLVKVMKAAS